MKCLVTGGAGFLGSHLCEFLLDKGHEVICVDNLFTGRKENIKHLLENKNFKFIPHDITKEMVLHEAVDQIYNLACPASPVHYQRTPVETVLCNTIGVINMLELAKLHGARILQASTSEVYGDPLEHPQNENYRGNVNFTGPRACYDEGKRVAETLFFDYHRQFKIDIRIARIFNTYGPRMSNDDGRVVSNFITQALRDKPITIYGDGMQTRSFCYVSDTILGMYLLMNAEDSGPINLGNPNEITVATLANEIIKLTGSKSKIVFMPLPQDDPIKRKPDIDKAGRLLSCVPKIGLQDGLQSTISFFKQELSASK